MSNDELKSYLSKKAKQLDMGRLDALRQIQEELDRRYSKQARAISLNEGVLKVSASSASLASELRLAQVDLIKTFNQLSLRAVERLHIVIV